MIIGILFGIGIISTIIINIIAERGKKMINLESNFDQTITRAIDKFGAEKQLRQMQEEAGELIVATNKIFRDNNDQTTKELLEEMADMHIMLQQAVKIICKSEAEFIDMINFKLKKLEGYLNE